MEAFIKELYEQLQRDLQLVSSDVNAVRGYNLKAELAENAIRKMKEYFGTHPFPNEGAEIDYFKSWAPCFFKIQILNTSLYNLERSRITIGNREAFKECVQNEITRVQSFLQHHEDLWIYYLLGDNTRDRGLFINASPTKTEDFLTADGLYCRNSILLAKIMAYEEFLSALNGEWSKSEKLNENGGLLYSGNINKYRWNLNNAQTAEFVYAFVKLKCISVDEKDADVKDLVIFLKEAFGFEIDNIYDVEFHNRRRKKEKAPFLNALLHAYLGQEKPKC